MDENVLETLMPLQTDQLLHSVRLTILSHHHSPHLFHARLLDQLDAKTHLCARGHIVDDSAVPVPPARASLAPVWLERLYSPQPMYYT